MSFVDFKLNTEIKEDSPNEYLVHAYFCKGDYVNELNPITNVMESVYKRSSRFKEVSVLFLPGMTKEDLLMQLYDLLLSEKQPSEEVITQCVHP